MIGLLNRVKSKKQNANFQMKWKYCGLGCHSFLLLSVLFQESAKFYQHLKFQSAIVQTEISKGLHALVLIPMLSSVPFSGDGRK